MILRTDDNREKVIIHATDRPAFKSCRQKYYYSSILRLDKVERGPDYFTFGTAGHKGLEAFYKHSQDPIEVFEQYMVEHNQDWESIELGKAIFRGYEAKYGGEDVGEVIFAEETKVVTYGDVEIHYTMDLVTKQGNGYTVWDHKFLSSFPSEMEVSQNDQATIYLWGMRKMGLWPARFVLNVNRKAVPDEPRLLKSGKLSVAADQLTTPELYRQAIQKYELNPDDYAEFLMYLDNREDPFFRRYTISRSNYELDRFDKDLWKEIVDMTSGIFYRNPGYQCTKCKFFELCRTDFEGGDFEAMKNAYYKQKEDHQR